MRGYQSRWVENYKVQPQLKAVGPWNKDGPEDELNRAYFAEFAEFVEVVGKALHSGTFSHQGDFWQFPLVGYVNPHEHPHC
ncbi:MAG: hypothetical protein V2I41_19400 [Pseudomonadales bacterium]|nr:hypothetical protein [Pseudomonadales bacterium]